MLALSPARQLETQRSTRDGPLTRIPTLRPIVHGAHIPTHKRIPRGIHQRLPVNTPRPDGPPLPSTHPHATPHHTRTNRPTRRHMYNQYINVAHPHPRRQPRIHLGHLRLSVIRKHRKPIRPFLSSHNEVRHLSRVKYMHRATEVAPKTWLGALGMPHTTLHILDHLLAGLPVHLNLQEVSRCPYQRMITRIYDPGTWNGSVVARNGIGLNARRVMWPRRTPNDEQRRTRSEGQMMTRGGEQGGKRATSLNRKQNNAHIRRNGTCWKRSGSRKRRQRQRSNNGRIKRKRHSSGWKGRSNASGTNMQGGSRRSSGQRRRTRRIRRTSSGRGLSTASSELVVRRAGHQTTVLDLPYPQATLSAHTCRGQAPAIGQIRPKMRKAPIAPRRKHTYNPGAILESLPLCRALEQTQCVHCIAYRYMRLIIA